MNSLVEFWRAFDFARPPFIHPRDAERFGNAPEFSDKRILNHVSFVNSERFDPRDAGFHLSLLPVPYVGDLAVADIFVLLLNPGFAFSSYQTEEDAEYRSLAVRNLQQDFVGRDFPFLSLDPALAWTGGFQWWHRKLRKIIQCITDEMEISYLDAMQSLSGRLAAIEMVPYRSESFEAGRLVKELPSAIAARDYVRGELSEKAKKGDATIIVTRKVREWGIPATHAVVYEGGHTRGAHLGPNTLGGQAILKRYGIDAPPM